MDVFSPNPTSTLKIIALVVLAFLGSIWTGAVIGRATSGVQKFGFSNIPAQPFVNVSPTSTSAATTTRFFGSVSPQTNAQYDLGEPSFSWNNVYASGTIIASAVSSTGTGTSSFLNIKVTSSTNPVLVGNGTVNGPGFAFIASPKTGIFSQQSNDLSIGTGGSTKMDFFGSNITVTNADLVNGSSGSLGVSGSAWVHGFFSGNVYSSSTLFGSTAYLSSSTGALAVGNGTQNQPAITTIADHTTGIWFPGAGQMRTQATTEIDQAIGGNVPLIVLSSLIEPGAGNQISNGNTNQGWKNMYVSSTIFTNSVVSEGSILATANNVDDLGSVTSSFKSIYASSTVFLSGVSSTGGIYPKTNNTYDNGGSGLAWKGVYASSSQVVFSGLAANFVTDNFVCISTTGTLLSETANCTVSSIRFKEHVESLDKQKLFDEVLKLRAVEYNRKADGVHEEGLIAEEVAMIDPLMVVWENGSPEDIAFVKGLYPDLKLLEKDGKTLIPKTVDYMKLGVLEAGAFQGLYDRVVATDQRVTAVEHRVGFLEWLFASLKAFIHTIRF